MRQALAIVLIAICVFPAFQASSPSSPAASVENISYDVNWFGNGKTAITADFPSAGVDDTNNLSLQSGMYIDQAKLKVSTVDQGPGSKAYPTNLSVDFGGDSIPEWQFRGKGVGQFGRQTTFINGFNAINLTLPYNGGTNLTYAIRLPKGATVSSAKMNVSAGASLGAGGKILLAAADYLNYAQDVQTKLLTFPDVYQVDIVSTQSTTPTLAELKQYSVVFTWGNYGYADSTTLGNNLADYIDSGGGVVLAVFAMGGGTISPGGKFSNNNDYLVMPFSGYQYSSGSLGTYISGHPLMNNVNKFSALNYRPSSSQLVTGSTMVAAYTDGIPLIATRTVKGVDRVDLGFFPPSSDVLSSWDSSTDGKHILHNAAAYVGRRDFNASLDMLGDSTYEWSNKSFNSTAEIPEFTDMLNGYLATAETNFTDVYGNEFIDIPVAVSSNMSGMLQLCNLSITYSCTIDIGPNPAGDLASSLADYQSSNIGTENSTIPLLISSVTAGKARLHDLYLKISPPVHKPTINSFQPAAITTIKENSQLDFKIDVVDWYGNPMKMKWFFDGTEVPDSNRSDYGHFFDYESAGNHSVRVEIFNGLGTAEQGWALTVLDVDRPPMITDHFPAANPSIDENETQLFRVNATDPDRDPLSYKWAVDGKTQPDADKSSFLFITDFTSAGDYSVKVMVSDPRGMTAVYNWTLSVQNVNVPPMIAASSPKSNPRILELELSQFSVTPFDPDGQTLTTTWYVDDQQAFVGNPFMYTTDYKSAGVHRVTATVSDGKESVSRSWDITVVNVNRPPVAAIDSPTESEFMQGASIHFSASSSYDPDNEPLAYSWKEGGVNVSDQPEFDRSFPPGLHTLTLEVRDIAGGVSSATVRFRVRFVELSVIVGTDRLDMVAGDKLDVIVTLSNAGDANATGVELEVLVDGKSIGTRSYETIGAGGGTREVFTWKAMAGTHTITARIGEQTWTKDVSVQKAPVVETKLDIWLYAISGLMVVAAVVLAVFGSYALKRK